MLRSAGPELLVHVRILDSSFSILSFPPTRCKPVDGRGVEHKNVKPRSTIKNDGLVTNIMSFVKYLIPSNYLHE